MADKRRPSDPEALPAGTPPQMRPVCRQLVIERRVWRPRPRASGYLRALEIKPRFTTTKPRLAFLRVEKAPGPSPFPAGAHHLCCTRCIPGQSAHTTYVWPLPRRCLWSRGFLMRCPSSLVFCLFALALPPPGSSALSLLQLSPPHALCSHLSSGAFCRTFLTRGSNARRMSSIFSSFFFRLE